MRGLNRGCKLVPSQLLYLHIASTPGFVQYEPMIQLLTKQECELAEPLLVLNNHSFVPLCCAVRVHDPVDDQAGAGAAGAAGQEPLPQVGGRPVLHSAAHKQWPYGWGCCCRARTCPRSCAPLCCSWDGDPSWYHSLPTRCPRWLQLTCLLPLACLAHRRRISRGSGRTEEQVGNFTTEQLPA